MNEVQVRNPPPAIFRWLTCLAGLVILVVGPAFGVKCIVTQHVEQKPQMNGGHQSEGFELHGSAAVVFGTGFIGLGLSMGYGVAFRFSRKESFEASRLDRFALRLLFVSIAALVVSYFLPTRTAWGEGPPDAVQDARLPED